VEKTGADHRRWEGRLGNVAGALLLGGASSRMGCDKATLKLDGVAWAVRIAGLLETLFDEVLLVGGRAPAAAPGRAVTDVRGPQCALRGLVSALESSRCERVVVVSTDVPLVRVDLLLALTAWPEHDAVVPRRDGRRHPLCAIYRRDPVLTLARARLEAGELRLGSLLDALDTDYLEGADLAAVDPDRSALSNINTPEDLATLEAQWAGGAAPDLFDSGASG